MKIEDFYFDLPKELIAQEPAVKRIDSRLLVLNKLMGNIEHRSFSDIIEYLNEGDVLVLNDTKVIKARLRGKKITGGKVELLVFQDPLMGRFCAVVKGKMGLKNAVQVNDINIFLKQLKGNIYVIEKSDMSIMEILDKYGSIPLPPYIKREAEIKDMDRYQTVFATKNGSVASPTAALHFQPELLKKFEQKGVKIVYITLHVGPGTFLPIKSKDIKQHEMLPEYCEVSHNAANTINEAINNKNEILFCGTTTVRTIEWASTDNMVLPKKGPNNLYIYPGYSFKVVRHMLTNFHLPSSTPLLLVTALAGKDIIFKAYMEAIEKKYRFFSYGDAMLIW